MSRTDSTKNGPYRTPELPPKYIKVYITGREKPVSLLHKNIFCYVQNKTLYVRKPREDGHHIAAFKNWDYFIIEEK